MKEKLIDIYIQYKLAIIVGFSIFVIGLVGIIIFFIFIDNSIVKEFKNNYYSVKYDKSWRIKSKKDKVLILEHKKGSKLNIEIIDLVEEYKYSSVDELLDELLYGIENQNKNYKLLYKKSDSITSREYDGYRMLYENDDRQAMVAIAKKSDKLLIFTFDAKNEYFDILLDSVQNIIYSFDTIERKYDLSEKLNFKTEKINYESGSKIDALIDKSNKFDIAYNNYHVTYTIPDIFKLSEFNSTIGSFYYYGDDFSSISISTSIYTKNIYEYLDKNISFNIYSEFNYYKNNKDSYFDFAEAIDKITGKYTGFIYKCSFYSKDLLSKDSDTKELSDNYILVYELDRNHIFMVKVSSSKVPITKKLIDSLKIESVKNYSNYNDSTIKNGIITSKLRRYRDINKTEVEEFNISLPNKYNELDKGLNLYSNRNYGLNYNRKLDIYDYDISITLTTTYTNLDNQIKLINDSYNYMSSKHSDLSYIEDRVINGKMFKIYNGNYNDYAGIILSSEGMTEYHVDVKVLFYELSSGGFLIIRIDGNNKQVTDDILNEISNFELV